MEAWRTEAPPGGETLASLVARVATWRNERTTELATGGDARDVLAVTHAGVIRALRAVARGVTYEAILESDGAVPHLAPRARRSSTNVDRTSSIQADSTMRGAGERAVELRFALDDARGAPGGCCEIRIGSLRPERPYAPACP